MLRTIAFLCFIALILSPVRSDADFKEEISADFAPFSAYLVMPVDTEWIIDADAAKGTVPGDLFTLVRPGKKIIHPVTGEVLGSLDGVEALLQVSRVKSGYSYATPLTGGDALKAGEEIYRYKGVPALFRDDMGGGEALFQLLEGTLPELDWTMSRSEESTSPQQESQGLLFILDAKGLAVKTSSNHLLHTYPLETLPVVLPQPEPPATVPPPAAVVIPPKASSQTPASAIVRTEPLEQQGVWRGPKMVGSPVGIEVIDLDGDGTMETAICFKDRLEVGKVVDGNYTPLVKMQIESPLHPLALDGADLDADGRGELYVTASRNMRLASFSVAMKDGLLSLVDDGIPWFFRAVPLEGTVRTLLAQRLGDERDFSGSVFRVERRGNDLEEGEAVDLPSVLSLYGFLPFTGENAERLFATLSSGDLLQAYTSEGTKLWESATPFGGTESSFERPEKGMAGDVRYLFLKARIERLADGSLLLPVNEGSRLTALRQFRNSHLSALTWDGYAFVESWHTAPQGGYLADFRLADIDNDGNEELVTIVLFSRKGFFSKGTEVTSILAYDME